MTDTPGNPPLHVWGKRETSSLPVFCRNNPMNNIAVLIVYLQFYKSFSKELEKPKIYGTIFFFLFLQYM